MTGLVAVTRPTMRGYDGRAVSLATAMAQRLGHRGPTTDVREVGGGAIALVGDAVIAAVDGVTVGLHGNVTVASHVLPLLRPRLGDASAENPAALAAAAIARWGSAGLARLSGDFALVALSADGQLVVAGRDRSGLKPLLWREYGGSALFASEASALVDVAGLPRPAVNEAMVAEYLSGAPQHRAQTMWSRVDRVQPRTAVVGVRGRHVVEASPFDLSVPAQTNPDWDGRLHDVFVDAVRTRLDDGGVTAVELSGGFDSTTVLGVACALSSPNHLIAATRDYSGTPTDETVYWRAALDEYQVPALITPWDVEFAPWMLDDAAASADRPCLPHLGPWRYELSVLSSRGVAVSLTGQGGDERLGHSYQLPWELLGSGRVLAAASAVQHHINYRTFSRKAAWRHLLSRGPLRLASWRQPNLWRSDRHIRTRRWLRPELVERSNLVERLRPPRWTSESMTVNELAGWAFGEIPNQYLEASERCAARHGIDLRHPFADPDLVELCLTMPEPVRTSPDDPRGAHRRVFGKYLPEAVLNRNDKADFTSQYVNRMSSEGIFVNAGDAAVVEAGWIDRDWLTQALSRLANGSNRSAALLSIHATVEAWAQRWT